MNKPIDAALFEKSSNEVRHGHSDSETFINETLYHLTPSEREEFSELISSFAHSSNLNESAAYTIKTKNLVVNRMTELMLKIGKYHALDVCDYINENGLDRAA